MLTLIILFSTHLKHVTGAEYVIEDHYFVKEAPQVIQEVMLPHFFCGCCVLIMLF